MWRELIALTPFIGKLHLEGDENSLKGDENLILCLPSLYKMDLNEQFGKLDVYSPDG